MISKSIQAGTTCIYQNEKTPFIPLHYFEMVETVDIQNEKRPANQIVADKMDELFLRYRKYIICERNSNYLHFFMAVHPVVGVIRYIRFKYLNYVLLKSRAATLRKIKTGIIAVIILMVIISLIYFGYSFMDAAFYAFN